VYIYAIDLYTVFHYYQEEVSLLLMIYVYEKSKTEDLAPKQIELLKKTFIQE